MKIKWLKIITNKEVLNIIRNKVKKESLCKKLSKIRSDDKVHQGPSQGAMRPFMDSFWINTYPISKWYHLMLGLLLESLRMPLDYIHTKVESLVHFSFLRI